MIERSPRLGYALAAAAAALFGISGSFARALLDDGISAWHLTELRSVLTFVLLVGWLLLTNRALLRVEREDVKRLAFLGVCGLAAVQSTYFAAIARLDIGVALTIQYLAPGLILVYLAVVKGARVPGRLWGAVALAVAGCFLVVGAYDADDLDSVGLLWAVACMVAFAINLLASEKAGERLDSRTTLAWGFGFCTLVFVIALPPWNFPFEEFDSVENVLLGLGVGVLGTLVPFILIVTALRHIPAAHSGVIMTLEPVVASLVAWVFLDQVLVAAQVAGMMVVVTAVAWVQSHRPDQGHEAPVH